jgi:hypothetical protein
VRIEIPAGVASARPQPKPGWTYDVLEREPDPIPRPRRRRSPSPAACPTTSSTTSPADEAAGVNLGEALVFPVIQTCEKGESQWTEVPDPERARREADPPRPDRRLIPAESPCRPPGHQH